MASSSAKKLQLLSLLAQGVATVHLDARQDGVRVPLAFRGCDALVLSLAYGFYGVELILTDEQVGATLHFGGMPFRCIVPFSAIWGVTAPGSKGNVWVEDIPHEFLLRLGEASQHAAEARLPRRERARMVN